MAANAGHAAQGLAKLLVKHGAVLVSPKGAMG
jgi:hypothetical protein